MNHEEFIYKSMAKFFAAEPSSKARKIQEAVASEAIKAYREHSYHDIDQLINDTVSKILKYQHLGRPVTIKQYAEKTGISYATARKYLKSLAVCDNTKRPFIFLVQ